MVAQPGGAAPDGRARREFRVHLGLRRAALYLPLDQVFPQTNVSQFIVLPGDLKVREALRMRLPALLAQDFPEVRGASPAAQRPAGALPGAVPRGRR